MNRSDFDFVDDPTVAINDEGFVGIAWADQSRHDIFFQVYGPSPRRPAALARTRGESGSGRAGGPAGTKRLAEPVNVSKSPRIFSWLPRLVIGPGDANDAYLLWQEIVFSPGGTHGGEAFFARSTDGGRTFGQPINLSNSIAGDGKGRLTRRFWHNGSLDLGQGPEGHLYAAWTEYQGKLWFSRSTDGGVSFSDPLHVAGDKQAPARGPSLAVDAEGGTVYLAWTVGEDAAADIRFAKSVDQGRSFGEPRIVFLSGGHADA
ncbi:MAG: sialidase family protein, partial [Kiloniellales bacterium]